MVFATFSENFLKANNKCLVFVSLENGVREVFKKNELRRTSSILNV